MDPVTLILAALSAGAVKGAEQVVKDGYAGLKALIVRRFGAAQPKLAERLDDYATDSETFAKPAEKALRDAGAGDDAEIVRRAAELLEATGGPPAQVSIGQINATNVAVVTNLHGDLHQG
jgi:hypothetical protein